MNQHDLALTQAFGKLAIQAMLIADIICSGLEPEDQELQAYLELRAQVFGDNL